jgi:long-subunit acyl-CoA synthetase (AMP-forming)
MPHRPEFHVADIAAMHLGATPLALDPALTAEQAAPLIKDSGARVMIVGQGTVERALAIRETGRTALRAIVAVDETATASVMSWPELLECIPGEFELDSILAAVQPPDVALLAYDAADIAPPALAEITHAELMAKLRDLSQRYVDKDAAAFAGLPMSHLPARLCTHYLAIVHGWQVTAR